jgi:Spy/CpxP family protein refolding chaperone
MMKVREAVLKLKQLPWLWGAIALVFFITPAPLKAQTAPPPGAQLSQSELFAKLGLSQQQQDQIQQVSKLAQAQIKSILSPEQFSQLQTLSEKGVPTDKAFATANVSAEQKSKIREIDRLAQQQLMAILTPEQIQQLSKLLQPSGR